MSVPSTSASTTSSVPHAQAQPLRRGVVIVYSHRDRDVLGELQVYLKSLQKAWMLELWDDLRVTDGFGGPELGHALSGARVVVLLISPGFLSSSFITDHHLPEQLASQHHPRAAVLCLYVRPAMDAFAEFKFIDPTTHEPRSVRISSFYGLNDPMRPLAALHKDSRAEVLSAAAEEIIRAAHRTPFSQY